MKTFFRCLTLVFCLVAFPCRADDQGSILYGGGDGTSFKSAVMIFGAKDDESNTHAEYVYLARHFPKYKMIRQSLRAEGDKYYDLLEFADADGAKHTVYFDITASFKQLQAELEKK